jgi:hypothetical protein
MTIPVEDARKEVSHWEIRTEQLRGMSVDDREMALSSMPGREAGVIRTLLAGSSAT